MSDLKKRSGTKNKGVSEKLKTVESITKAEPPASSHGSFWE